MKAKIDTTTLSKHCDFSSIYAWLLISEYDVCDGIKLILVVETCSGTSGHSFNDHDSGLYYNYADRRNSYQVSESERMMFCEQWLCNGCTLKRSINITCDYALEQALTTSEHFSA